MTELKECLLKLKKLIRLQSDLIVEYCLEALLLCLHIEEVRTISTTVLLALSFENSNLNGQEFV